jgi:hypothetical protein
MTVFAGQWPTAVEMEGSLSIVHIESVSQSLTAEMAADAESRSQNRHPSSSGLYSSPPGVGSWWSRRRYPALCLRYSSEASWY